MPTRTSMKQLSNIWTNPYGGTSQNELNDEIGDDTTRYHLSLLAEERARLENDRMAEQNRQIRAASPENMRYRTAEDLNYNVGLFNSPLGYQGRRMQDKIAEEEAARLQPTWEHEVEKAVAPWEQRVAVQQLRNQGNIDVQGLKNSGAADVADTKAFESMIGRMIMGQFSQATARERALGGIAEAGVNRAADVPGAVQQFSDAPRAMKTTTWDKLQAYARREGLSLRDAWELAAAEGYDVK